MLHDPQAKLTTKAEGGRVRYSQLICDRLGHDDLRLPTCGKTQLRDQVFNGGGFWMRLVVGGVSMCTQLRLQLGATIRNVRHRTETYTCP